VVVGRRCLTRGLSDIAAMGGEPIAAFLSLALPPRLPQRWVDGFLKGLLTLADEFKVTLAGGDTSQSPQGILADIVVVGSVPRGKAILRSGTRPGDGIYVTGELGGSAAALKLLYSRKYSRKKLKPLDFPAHFFPNPRIKVGQILREKAIASSMIDISDGLSTDLSHICEESRVGAEVWQDAVPRASIDRPAREVSLEAALHGGEDYELLFTSSRRVPDKIAGVTITQIGRITRKKKVMLADSHGSLKELLPKGWEHFGS
jgi:thiamine-monophosphate kinase